MNYLLFRFKVGAFLLLSLYSYTAMAYEQGNEQIQNQDMEIDLVSSFSVFGDSDADKGTLNTSSSSTNPLLENGPIVFKRFSELNNNDTIKIRFKYEDGDTMDMTIKVK